MFEAVRIVVSFFVPLVLTLQAFCPLFTELLLPVSGRMRTLVLPEILFGLGIGGVTTLMLLGLSDVLVDRRNSLRLVRLLCLFGFAVSAGFVLFRRNPYSPSTPKRLFLQEAEQRMADGSVERFLVAIPIDFNKMAPFARSKKREITEQSLFRTKENFVHEGFLPHYFPLADFVQHMEIYQGSPSRRFLENDLLVDVDVSDRGSSGRRMKVKIRTKGQVTIVTIPDEGLRWWSLTPEIPVKRRDCKCHFVKFAQGGEETMKSFEFTIEVEKGKQLRAEISSHFIDEFPRPDLQALAEELGVMQPWTAPVFFSTAGVELKY
jgi:hypothetical protein